MLKNSTLPPFFVYYIYMTTLDIILLVFVGIGFVLGFTKGFIRQLTSILGLVVGLIAAKMLYASLAEKICPIVTESMTVAQVISFLGIWIIVPLLFSLVAYLLTKAFEAVSLGFLNRLLGAIFGMAKFLLLAMLIIAMIDYLDPEDKLIVRKTKESSKLYGAVQRLNEYLFPVAAKATQNIYNQIQ